MGQEVVYSVLRYYARKNERLLSRINDGIADSMEAYRLRRAIRINQKKMQSLFEAALPCGVEKGYNNGNRNDSPDDEVTWVTINGAHVPLNDNGTAVSGALKGKRFSEAESNSSQKQNKSNKVSAPKFGGKTSKEFVSKLKTTYDAHKEKYPRDAWRVTVHTQEELDEWYTGAKLHTTDGGSTIAVTADGDIISVCKHPDDAMKGKQLIELAVANGGTKLDSYSGNHGFYIKCGFEPVSWCEFDEQYAPSDWDKGLDKAEPIIFYKYTGRTGSLSEDDLDVDKFFQRVAVSADYDEAQKKRDDFL